MLLISVFYAGWLVLTARRELARCHVASLIKFHANDGFSQKTAAERHSFRLLGSTRTMLHARPSCLLSLTLPVRLPSSDTRDPRGKLHKQMQTPDFH